MSLALFAWTCPAEYGIDAEVSQAARFVTARALLTSLSLRYPFLLHSKRQVPHSSLDSDAFH